MSKHPLATRTTLLALIGAALAVGAFLLAGGATADKTPAATIQVYKTPTCGCCSKWIEHLRAAGFKVEATDMPDLTAFKAANGVPDELSSCHTATVAGYVIEGHVPASDISRLLQERPKVAGLTVPGMPMGSPGMEHPNPQRHEAFDVLAFGGSQASGSDESASDKSGVTVFSSHVP